MTATPLIKPLPDIAQPGLAVIFCGLNPGLTSAQAGHHFKNRSNRFWRVLHRSGFTPQEIAPEDGAQVLAHGLGLTTVVARPSANADDVATAEFAAAGADLEAFVRRHAPRYLAFLGKPAYAALIGRRTVDWGRQAEPFAGAVAWVLPNPSGRNRAFSEAALVEAYGALRAAAGEVSGPAPAG